MKGSPGKGVAAARGETGSIQEHLVFLAPEQTGHAASRSVSGLRSHARSRARSGGCVVPGPAKQRSSLCQGLGGAARMSAAQKEGSRMMTVLV